MNLKDKWIYFAAPLFTAAERQFNETLSQYIEHAGYAVFLPQNECAHASKNEEIFLQCIRGLDNAWCVVAVLDGSDVDSGTSFEAGYAYAKGIPIIGIRTDFRNSGDDGHCNLMLSKSIAAACFVNSQKDNAAEELAECLQKEITALLLKAVK